MLLFSFSCDVAGVYGMLPSCIGGSLTASLHWSPAAGMRKVPHHWLRLITALQERVWYCYPLASVQLWWDLLYTHKVACCYFHSIMTWQECTVCFLLASVQLWWVYCIRGVMLFLFNYDMTGVYDMPPHISCVMTAVYEAPHCLHLIMTGGYGLPLSCISSVTTAV